MIYRTIVLAAVIANAAAAPVPIKTATTSVAEKTHQASKLDQTYKPPVLGKDSAGISIDFDTGDFEKGTIEMVYERGIDDTFKQYLFGKDKAT